MPTDGIIKSTDLIDAAGLVADLAKITAALDEIAKTGKNQLKEGLAPLQSIKIGGAQSIKDLTAEIKKQEAAIIATEKATREKIKTSQLQLKAEQQLSDMIKKQEAQQAKLNKTNIVGAGIYNQSVARLAEVKKILKELEITGRTNGKIYKALGEEFVVLNGKVRDAEEGVGEFQRNVGNYKQQLREAIQDMQRFAGVNEDAFNEARDKAAELKDKIGDLNEEVNQLASGSKVEQAENVFGGLKDSIENLDFEKAAEKTKLLGEVVGKISFKELAGGVKQFGSALSGIASTILSSPIFIIAAVVTGVGIAIYKAVSAWNDYNEVSKTVLESQEALIESIGKLKDRYKNALIDILEATGQISKQTAEISRVEVTQNRERLDLQKEFNEKKKKLAEELDVDLKTGQKNFNAEDLLNAQGYQVMKQLAETKFKRELIALEKQYGTEVKETTKTQQKELDAIREKQRQEQIEKEKEEQEKLRKQAEEAYKKRLEDEKNFRKRLRDLQIEDIEDDRKRELARLEQDNLDEIKEIKSKGVNKDLEHALLLELETNFHLKKNEINARYDKERADEIERVRKEQEEKIKADLEKTRVAEEAITQENIQFKLDQLNDAYERERALAEKTGGTINAEEMKRLQELLTAMMELRKQALRDRAAFELENTELNDAQRKEIENKLQNDLLRIDMDAAKKKEDLEKATNEKRKEMAFDYLNKSIDLVEKEVAETSRLRQQAIDKEISQRQKAIETQSRLAEKGLSNTLAFQEQELAKAELRKEQEAQRQKKREKALAFLKLLSGYAEKDASTALQKSLVDIALASVIENAFAEGVEKLEGPGSETSDSILARLSKGESVVTAKGTKENPGLATAMNEGRVDDYFKKEFLPDYAMQMQAPSFASNVYESAQLMQLVSLNKNLETINKTIEERPVHQNELTAMGEYIQREIKRGIEKTIINKPSRL